jgi:hypothetical protein
MFKLTFHESLELSVKSRLAVVRQYSLHDLRYFRMISFLKRKIKYVYEINVCAHACCALARRPHNSVAGERGYED